MSRYDSILNAMHGDLGTSHTQLGPNTYELKTDSEVQKIWIKFEEVKSYIRVHYTHVFGWITDPERLSKQELLQLLAANHGTFNCTSAFLALSEAEGSLFTSLQAYHVFRKSSPDSEIGDILLTQFLDIQMGLMTRGVPSCITFAT